MLYDVEYIDGHNTSSSYLIQLYSNTPYYMIHIFPGEAPIRKDLFLQFHISLPLHSIRQTPSKTTV
jgi:hypothetical protein